MEELDDIERVLDHAGMMDSSWRPEWWEVKVTDTPYKGICPDGCLLWAIEQGASAIVVAAYEQGQKELARELSDAAGKYEL